MKIFFVVCDPPKICPPKIFPPKFFCENIFVEIFFYVYIRVIVWRPE